MFRFVIYYLVFFSMAEFLVTDLEVPGSIPGPPDFLKSMCLERGPLSLVKITEELPE
jgi:hypothetical protein